MHHAMMCKFVKEGKDEGPDPAMKTHSPAMSPQSLASGTAGGACVATDTVSSGAGTASPKALTEC